MRCRLLFGKWSMSLIGHRIVSVSPNNRAVSSSNTIA
jgi:hypothetical protein